MLRTSDIMYYNNQPNNIYTQPNNIYTQPNNAYTQPNNAYYVSSGQFDQLQGQVNDVTQIMRNNIQLGIQRGANLDDLQIKAEDLNNYSQQFAFTAHEVHKKYWWQNVYMWILLIVVIIIILILVIALPILASQHKI
ncbi:unnamed protein product [Rotaria sp. Silwood2]|nr:unnamed protein product [Rotaria sp. Silwood2]CAF3129980.1 unnamed protein product [Rotaria sp. Silwood2]CAF4099454.1 unnamed protein product [Rotaria sp. Silwood2]CAF4276753.1 unnamed protein product [Rotaria sp. Silwood2]